MTKVLHSTDQRVAWATEVVLYVPELRSQGRGAVAIHPQLRSAQYGGTIVLGRSHLMPAHVVNHVEHQAPVLQKKDDEQTALLKKILAGLQTRPAPQPPPGLQMPVIHGAPRGGAPGPRRMEFN